MDVAYVKRLFRPYAHRLARIVTLQRTRLDPKKTIAEFRNGRYPLLGRLSLITWQDPDPRAIVPLDDRLHIGKRLEKKIESGYFTVTFDQAFRDVLKGCATTRPGREKTWLSRDMMDLYIGLHEYGYAHSTEVWREGRMVGGQFGVSVGGYYSSASMFHIEDHASKVGFAVLAKRLRERRFMLLDLHQVCETSTAFGGYALPLPAFRVQLADAIASDVRF
jgi:leucyl/phenylalanyl-tRNA--protein transferase